MLPLIQFVIPLAALGYKAWFSSQTQGWWHDSDKVHQSVHVPEDSQAFGLKTELDC